MGKKWKQWQTLFSWAPESLWTITMVFPVVVYGCEPKNWCFLTVVLKKTLESPLGSKEIQPVHPKGNQSWVFIEGLMLKLKVQHFGHLMWRTDSFGKTLMLGKTEGRRRRGWQRMRWLDGTSDLVDLSLSTSSSCWYTGKSGVLRSVGSQRVRHDWEAELNWTEP